MRRVTPGTKGPACGPTTVRVPSAVRERHVGTEYTRLLYVRMRLPGWECALNVACVSECGKSMMDLLLYAPTQRLSIPPTLSLSLASKVGQQADSWGHSVLHVRIPKVECRGFSSHECRRAMVHMVQNFAFLLVIVSWDSNAGQ